MINRNLSIILMNIIMKINIYIEFVAEQSALIIFLYSILLEITYYIIISEAGDQYFAVASQAYCMPVIGTMYLFLIWM